MHLPGQELPYDPNQVTPGVIGFAVTALFAVVVMLLLWDFNRRVRRINDREDVKERLQAELEAAAREAAEREAGAAPPATPLAETATPAPASPAEPEAPQPPRA